MPRRPSEHNTPALFAYHACTLLPSRDVARCHCHLRCCFTSLPPRHRCRRPSHLPPRSPPPSSRAPPSPHLPPRGHALILVAHFVSTLITAHPATLLLRYCAAVVAANSASIAHSAALPIVHRAHVPLRGACYPPC
ncbi:hypothetical protein BDW22DRAFT_869775 [Trametopsis cervina]|nr:hypothetical protein BDW22DRAFT_869775 [Trametopsis cervina]